MEIQRVNAGNGWDWFVRGWGLFAKDPALWIILILIYAVIAIVLNAIPLLGGLSFMLISPALAGGLYFAAQTADNGGKLEIGQLFQAFQDKERTRPMLTLGAISLGFGILMGLVVMLSFGSLLGAGAMMHEEYAETAGTGLLVGGFLGLIIVSLVMLAATMALFYAVPLVMLSHEEPIAAVKLSFSACLSNVLPLLVFGLVYLVLGVLATIPFGLGWIVLFPVSLCAAYSSYKDILTV